MVAMFQESLDVLTEKEVEKRAPKKGIIASAAKDTLKEVVDDDLVRKDKVGVSWYFWSFPSDKQAKDQAQLAALRREAAKQEGQLQALGFQKTEEPKEAQVLVMQRSLEKIKMDYAGDAARLKETQAINKSLSALGDVIAALKGAKFYSWDTMKGKIEWYEAVNGCPCILYTSPSQRDQRGSRMPCSA